MKQIHSVLPTAEFISKVVVLSCCYNFHVNTALKSALAAPFTFGFYIQHFNVKHASEH
jgi:hypothetical protein